MFRPMLLILGLASGCAAPDQGFWNHSPVSPGWPDDMARLEFLEDRDPAPSPWDVRHRDFPGQPGHTETIDEEPPEIEMSFEAVMQRTRWGESLGRCQIEVAFREKSDPEDTGPPPGNPGDVIWLPETSGECAYTALRPMEPGAPGGEGDGADDWELEGSLSGADTIYLHSPQTTLTLHRQAVSGGKVRYELPSCTMADFPFGQIFDLEVPHLEGAAIPGFYIEEALAVGPDVTVRQPMVSLSAETLFHPSDRPLVAVWDDAAAPPEVLGDRLDARRMIFVRNHHEGEHHPFEALACLPPDRQMTLPPETLAALQANPDAATEHYYLAFQIDTVFETPEFEAPWGQSVFARSTVSESGEIHLYD